MTRSPAPGTGTIPGLRAGLVLAGLLLVASNLRASLTTVGPVLPQIESDLGITSFAGSMLVSLPLLAFAVVSPFAPRLANRMGLERAVATGLGVLVVGILLRSTPPIALLWAGTALVGVAISILNVLLPSLVKRDFPMKIGQVTGAYSAVQSAVAAVAAAIAVPVAGATALGWRLPLAMWAGLALIALGVLAPQLGRQALPQVASAAPAAEPPRLSRSPWRTALGWQVTAFMGLQSTNFYVLITWLPSIETSAGVGRAEAGVHLSLVNLFGIVGSLGASALIARLRDQRAIGTAVGMLLLVSTLGFLTAPHLSVIWAFVAGLGGGSSIVLSLSLFGLRTHHHTHAASLSAMAQCVGYLVAAAGPVVVGAIHDSTGSWRPALIMLLVVDAAVAVSGYLAGRSRTLV